MKNSNDIIWDRNRDPPICSAAPEPLCHRGPRTNIGLFEMIVRVLTTCHTQYT